MPPEPLSILILKIFIDLLPLWVLLIAWATHSHIQRKRRRTLEEDEQFCKENISYNNLKTFPSGRKFRNPVLVTGTVVIANDYFAAFLSGFRTIFGGEMKSYTKFADDARRIATVRMLKKAIAAGATHVYNVRCETITINNVSQGSKQTGGIEMIVYGTAVMDVTEDGSEEI